MKNKLKFLTKMSLKKKMGTKWFLIANLIIGVCIIGLLNIDNIVKSFGGDFNEVTEILVIDNTKAVYQEFEKTYTESTSYLEDMKNTSLTSYPDSEESAKKELKKDNDKILLIINEDTNNYLTAQIITNKGSDAIINQVISLSLDSIKKSYALQSLNITPEQLAIIDTPVNIEKINLDDSATTDEMTEIIMGVVFPILILPFFMLTMFLVQMIGAEVNEEKTTKSMEIIISNVSPKTHFLSKILAGNIFVLSQGILIFLYFLIGIGIRLITGMGDLVSGEIATQVNDILNTLDLTGVLDKLIYIIPITILLMLITFVAYSLLAGVLASMTTNIEDYQQLQTPIIIVSVIGYYLAIMASVFEGSTFIQVVSYVPFISALLSPALLILGQISIVDSLISLGLMGITVWLLIKYGLKIYKVGILNYSQTHLWKKMFKAIK